MQPLTKIVSHINNTGEMAEWSNAAVLKTVVLQGTGGSNPSLSAELISNLMQNPVSHDLQGFFMRKSVHQKAEKCTF